MSDGAEVSLEGLAALLAASANTGTPPTDGEAALTALEAAVHIERSSQTILANSAAAARAWGFSWQAIGAVLGITRQAIKQAFACERGGFYVSVQILVHVRVERRLGMCRRLPHVLRAL